MLKTVLLEVVPPVYLGTKYIRYCVRLFAYSYQHCLLYCPVSALLGMSDLC